MKLALIAPTNQLHWCTFSTGGMQMALAHKVMTEPQYAEFYKQRSLGGDFIIMDNGVAEQSQLTPAELMIAGRLCGATEYVLPDVINDTERTLDLGYASAPDMGGGPLMVVPQGQTFESWTLCASELVGLPSAATIGLSKYCPVPRRELLEWLGMRGWYKRYGIHLLGTAEPSITHKLVWDYPWIRSMDTAAPVAYGLMERYLSSPKHAGLRWDALPADRHESEVILANIAQLRRWCNAHDS